MNRVHPTVRLRRRLILTAGACALAFVAAPALAQDTAVTSPKVTVTDTAMSTAQAPSPVTDGTGSYTTSAATAATKIAAPIKEIPNSVSVITRQVMDDWNMVTLYDALTFAPGVTAIPNDGTQAQRVDFR